MNRLSRRAVPLVLVSLLTGICATSGHAASATSITACASKSGALRILNKPATKCKVGERKLALALAGAAAAKAGPTGPTGPQGPAGLPGAPGTSGSPDTPGQVLDKLLGVDGTGSGLDADTLDGLNSTAFQHRGTTTTCGAGTFMTAISVAGDLTCAAPTTDASTFNGHAYSEFVPGCPAGYTYVRALCWETIDHSGYTYATASDKCSLDGGRIPLLTEFIALMKSGATLSGTYALDWTADSDGDDTAIFINNASDSNNPDGTRAKSTASWVRCVTIPRPSIT